MASTPYPSWIEKHASTCTTWGCNKYYYKVSAVNSGGESPLSVSVNATTLPEPPDVPTNVDAAAQGKDEIKITWNSVTGADGYVVYHATSAGGQYSILDSVTTTSYTHTGLTSSSTHYYKVSAYNSVGESDKSSYTSATTTGGKVAYITRCVSCGRCPSWCDLNAIKYSGGKYYIDQDLCDGCGDCLPSCPYDYIILQDTFKRAVDFVKGVLGISK